jgi:hypothetical protein
MVAGGSKVEASMKHSTFQGERLILTDPRDPRLPRNMTARDHIVAALKNPELIAIVVFCALGLVVTVGLMLLMPNFGEIAESLQAYL